MPTVVQNGKPDREPGGSRVPAKVIGAAVSTGLSALAWLLAPTLTTPDWTPFVRLIAFIVFVVLLGLVTAYVIARYRRRQR